MLVVPGFLAGPSGICAGWSSSLTIDSRPNDPRLRLGHLRDDIIDKHCIALDPGGLV